MWSPSGTPSKCMHVPLDPDDTLYRIDEPLLFVANVMLGKYLFYKMSKSDRSNFYLVVRTRTEIVKSSMDASLSLRGALSQTSPWVVETNENLNGQRFSAVRISDIPSKMLPPSGLALGANRDRSAADLLDQAISFFSFKFSGERLSNDSIPLSVFRHLVRGLHNFGEENISCTNYRRSIHRKTVRF